MYTIKACFVGQTVRSTGDRQSKGFLNLCNYQTNYRLQFQHNADGPGVVLLVGKSVFLNFQEGNQFSQWGLYGMTEATNWKWRSALCYRIAGHQSDPFHSRGIGIRRGEGGGEKMQRHMATGFCGQGAIQSNEIASGSEKTRKKRKRVMRAGEAERGEGR